MIGTLQSKGGRLAALVVAAVVLAGTPAAAARSFSDECKDKDSSTPPEGTRCIGGGYGVFGEPQSADFPGKIQWTMPGDPPQKPEELDFSVAVRTPANFRFGSQV